IVHVQNPVRLSELSEPEPDLALLQPRADYYAAAHPGPDDVLLIVEVADSSVVYDRTVKTPLYARAGIREFWLVDLERQQVEVSREPAAGSYHAAQVHGRGDRLAVDALPQIQISVEAILGD